MSENGNRKNASSLILVIIAGILVFILGFFIGRIDLENRKSVGLFLNGDVKGSYNGVDIDLLWEIWDKIDDEYIKDDLDGEVLLDGIVKGLVDSLDDPYTAYLNPEETQDYLNSNSGEFEGIGVTLRYTGDYTEIETPIDGFPAQEAGLLHGDVIIEVNGTDVTGKREYEVAQLIKGDAGTEVKIKITREGEDDPIEFSITRKKIDIDSITLDTINDDTVIITINQFTEESVVVFDKQWDDIISQIQAKDPDNIIVDVRNNPGGYVDSAVYVLEDFFPKGTRLMSERDKDGNISNRDSSRDGRLQNENLVVLINEGSASAAEIFSGAIQDHNRGMIIGQKSVGKGVEQRILTLSNGGSLHLVFQEWVLPSGRVIDKDNSITPDIEVDLTEEDFQNRQDPQLDRAKQEVNK